MTNSKSRESSSSDEENNVPENGHNNINPPSTSSSPVSSMRSSNCSSTSMTSSTPICRQVLSRGSFSQRFTPPPSPCPSTRTIVSSPDLPGPEVTSRLNWQDDMNSIRERNACMVNNDLMSDVTFILGSDASSQVRIPAHKYVLATGSSVFYAMFHGGLAEPRNEIEIPDVEPNAFLTLLRYLYCDEIKLADDNVLATLYTAKKYMVHRLSRACVQYLETSLNEKNACLLLSQSRLFEEENLTERCWEVIDAQAELSLTSDGFVEVDAKTLKSIIVRNTLNAKELSVFNALIRWSAHECEKEEMTVTPDNQRKVLGDLLYAARLPCMTLEEFANGPAQSGILSLQEVTDIFLHFTASQKPSLPFPTAPRQGLKIQTCHRFQSSAYRSNQWRYRGRCDSIQFSVDHRIFVVGFGLYGSSNGGSDYSVKMELKRMGDVLAHNHTSFFSDGSSNTFRVFFQHPIQVEPDTLYTASVVLEGGELSFFGQDGLSEVNVKGRVTFQFQCSTDSTNGTGVQGGQIPEILFYAPNQE